MSERTDAVVALTQNLGVEADLDIEVFIEGEAPYIVSLTGGRATVVETARPNRMVRFHLSAAGADRVAAGTANAQQLLAGGDLRIGGRIDVLQEEAASLAALGRG